MPEALRLYKNYRIVGENIYGVPKSYSMGEVFEDWMRSRGHKDNILNNKYREVGIGKGTGNFTMWSVDFGDHKSAHRQVCGGCSYPPVSGSPQTLAP